MKILKCVRGKLREVTVRRYTVLEQIKKNMRLADHNQMTLKEAVSDPIHSRGIATNPMTLPTQHLYPA